MSKDLTKLSRKELESKLAKKYGVEKYLNQRSQLLDLLGTKGETDIETGFTGPETEALSIMFENTNKAEGGIVNLLGGGKVNAPRQTDIKGQDHMLAYITPEEGGILKALGGSGKKGPMGIPSFAFGDPDAEADSTQPSGPDDGQEDTSDSYDANMGLTDEEVNQAEQEAISNFEKEIGRNPQLKGVIGKSLIDARKEGKLSSIERDKDGMITGGYTVGKAPGLLGALLGNVTTYTGYGKGFSDALGGGDDGDDTSEMVRKIVEEKKKEEDLPLTQEELDYYARGMGTATKPLKSLEDVNRYMSALIGSTESPTGAKLSKDKKFLILPNGKIINLRTGKVQESMSGLELFRGGMI